MSDIKNLTPREIVSELDRHIIGQTEAKRAVAIALRNRWRRLKVAGEMKNEITPKNIIMMGPTGVGKTEIARRLAKLADAPFIKVEASKFTEVGYVGKDVESMVRDLVEISIKMVREREQEFVRVKASELAEERLLDLLLPQTPDTSEPMNDVNQPRENAPKTAVQTREKLRAMLRAGKLDNRKIDLDISPKPAGGLPGHMPMVEIISSGSSVDDLSQNLKDMLGGIFPQGKKNKRVLVPEALKILTEDEMHHLIDMDKVKELAIELAENNGIIFVDEIDKIASDRAANHGASVSREGVQRDILPIIEGSTVSTKYGFVKTDHMLFIAAGAFHMSKPSDLIPELQGRFPIRVELHSLTEADFLRILKEPQNSLTRQYQALMETEGVTLEFAPNSLEEIAAMAARANDQMENIGARRLHTILEKVMDELSFRASEMGRAGFTITEEYVKKCLGGIIENQDLSRFIL